MRFVRFEDVYIGNVYIEVSKVVSVHEREEEDGKPSCTILTTNDSIPVYGTTEEVVRKLVSGEGISSLVGASQ